MRGQAAETEGCGRGVRLGAREAEGRPGTTRAGRGRVAFGLGGRALAEARGVEAERVGAAVVEDAPASLSGRGGEEATHVVVARALRREGLQGITRLSF